MSAGFFLKEAMRSVKRNAVPSFAAMASILVTVLVLGVFIPITQATTGAANDIRGKILVDVYLERDAGRDDIARVRERLEQDTRYVGRSSSSPSSRPTTASAAATPRPTSCWAPTRCPTPSASPRTTRTTRSPCATCCRRRPRAESARRSIPRSTW
jgi:hypothetical protein